MAMTDAEKLYRRTLAELRKVYGRTILDVAKRGDNVPEETWTELGSTFEDALKMQDIIAASNIHWRATHIQTNIPGPKATITDIMQENAWLNAHSMRTHPYIESLSQRVALIEKDYYIRRWSQGKLEPPLELKRQPLWRLEMFHRTTMGDVHATSQQVQLSDPAIGLRFPFAEYRSRDDGVARPTHKAMHKFVAHRSWEGWPRARPKTGFNCRCLLRFFAVFEAKLKGWLNANGSPRFIVRWPNLAAKINWDNGIFPDKGWHGPKFVASALPFGQVA